MKNKLPCTVIGLSAAPAGTYTSGTLLNENSTGVQVYVKLSTATHTSMVVTINGVDDAGNAYALLTSAAISNTTGVRLTVLPSIVAATNLAVSDALPTSYSIVAVISDSGGTAAATGTISATLVG